MKITHHFVSTSPDHELANGIVSIVRPLGPHEADVREYGPMYLCRCLFGEFVAYHHELDFDGYRKMPDAEYARIEEDAARRDDAKNGFAD